MSAKKRTSSPGAVVVKTPTKENSWRALIRCYFREGFADWEIGKVVIKGNPPKIWIVVYSKTVYTNDNRIGIFTSDGTRQDAIRKAEEIFAMDGAAFKIRRRRYLKWKKPLSEGEGRLF